MGRGDQYMQKRFSVPMTSGDTVGLSGHWPLRASSACCKCAASRRFFHAPTKSWLCGQCLAAQPQETR